MVSSDLDWNVVHVKSCHGKDKNSKTKTKPVLSVIFDTTI